MNFIPALPEIFLLSMICIVLLVDLFISQRNRLLTYGLTQFTLLGTLFLVLYLLPKSSTIIFGGGFIWDPLAALLKIFILGTSCFAFVYARKYISERNVPQGEYYLLGLFSVLGMLVLVSAYNFITLFIGLEILSLPLYAMVALQRNSAVGAEAAMKYFVMGAIASSMLLYGLSMIYGATHSLDIAAVAKAITILPDDQRLILVFGLVFVVAGLAFKLGAAPFHMWIPDVYQGAMTSVTLFVGSAPKIAAVGMVIRLLIDAMPSLVGQWQQVFVILAIASIALGNIVAIVQTNLKRMFAYSAIAHIGYMSLGILSATPDGYAAAVFYIIAYAIMTLGGFALLVLLSKANIEVEQISDLRGLNARNPWLAFMMLLILFSMAGVPPSVGFFAKLGVLQALINVHMVWLATLALVFAIIGAYYYLNVVKVMYFEEPEYFTPIPVTRDACIALSFNGLIVLGLGLFPGALIELCRSVFSI